MKRVFIISKEKFPRNSAGANYIQYFAQALMNCGWKVIVVAAEHENGKNEINLYRDIEYVKHDFSNILSKRDKIFLVNMKETYSMSEEDYFVFYNYMFYIQKYFFKTYGKDHIYNIRVENMQPCQFKLNRFNPKYILLQKAIKYGYKHSNGCLSISSVLCSQDKQKGVRTMCLPIMADPYEYDCNIQKEKQKVVHFIYPGMKVTGYEDDIWTMISALKRISKSNQERIKLHITGISKMRFFDKFEGENVREIESMLEVHGFLPYDDLVDLYKEMDFLLLIRKNNKITQANFPSKVPELLSYGVVPICTDVGDYTKRLLNERCAFIVQPDDMDGLKDAIEKALNISNKQYLEMRCAGRRVVEEKLYYKKWSQKIETFLGE